MGFKGTTRLLIGLALCALLGVVGLQGGDGGGEKPKAQNPGPGDKSKPADDAIGAAVHVDIRDIGDRPLPKAEVALRPKAAGGGPAIKLEFDKRGSAFQAVKVKPGDYILSAKHEGLASEERVVAVPPGGGREVVILGKEGLPFYYRGPVKVPFEPRPDLIAVSLRTGTNQTDEAVNARLKDLSLDAQKVPEEVRQNNVRLFRLAGEVNEKRKGETIQRLKDLPWVERAGPVIAVRERSLTYLTNELLVRFKPHVTEEAVRKIARQAELEILRVVSYSPNTYHFRAPGPASYALLDKAAALAKTDEVEWAEPNLVTTAEPDQIHPNDFLWPGVWDRRLVNTPGAWQNLQDSGHHRYGEPGIIIAGVDQGIQSSGGIPRNREFQGNVSNGTPKVYRLFDFRTLVPNNDNPMGDHGMGIAGVAAAMAENASPVMGQNEGLAGAAPNCRIMGLIFPSTEADIADMYIWAAGFDPRSPRPGFPAPISPGADVFTTSIGFGAGAPISGLARAMLDHLTTYGRGGKGCLCFFSSGNANNEFTTFRPWAAYEKSFGMAASTLDNDGTTEIRAPYSGFGPVALCAPSHDQFPTLHNPPANFATWSCQLIGAGNLIGHPATQTTLATAVTAGGTTLTLASVAGIANGSQLLIGLPGTAGSEPVMVTGPPNPATNQVPVAALLNNHAAGDPVMSGPNDYRNNFGGTSSATPLTAGVAALVLSANPDLTWIEARQILRDTAERIQPNNTDPVGQWLDTNGNPSVMSGQPPVYSRWFGFGRVNAERAVAAALAYPFSRDVVVRENLADGGTVPSGGAFWNSPDLWVRNVNPVTEGSLALPASYAAAGPHVSPKAGQDNWVYARFRNNGTAPTLDFFIRIYVTHYPGLEFTYPASFIPSNRPGDPVPSPMVPGTYLIGEVKQTALAPGADATVNVRWPAALVPPQQVTVGGMTVSWHPCLLLEVSPHDGPAPTGNQVRDDNNLAQKNITIDYPDSNGDFAMGLVVGNSEREDRYVILEIDRTYVPRQVKLYVDLINPRLKSKLHRLADPGSLDAGGEGRAYTFLEGARLQLDGPPGLPNGGLILTLPPKARLEAVAAGARKNEGRFNFSLGNHNGREVAYLADRGTTRIPVFTGGDALVPIVIGGVAAKEVPKATYRAHIVQRNPNDETTGGAELEIVVK